MIQEDARWLAEEDVAVKIAHSERDMGEFSSSYAILWCFGNMSSAIAFLSSMKSPRRGSMRFGKF